MLRRELQPVTGSEYVYLTTGVTKDGVGFNLSDLGMRSETSRHNLQARMRLLKK